LNVVVSEWHSAQAWFVGMWFGGLPPTTPLANETVEVWHVPQSAAVGMWLAGFVRTATPVKLWPAAWHAAQPLVMPAWFIAVPAKLAVDLWQVAQSALVGMCEAPRGIGTTPANPMPDEVAEWQVAHPDEIPA
jgi:hypothetical protein